MYPDRKYMDKPINDDLSFEPFIGEYDSPFSENLLSTYDNTKSFSDNFVPFSENSVPFLENSAPFSENVVPFTENSMPFTNNLYLNGFNNRSAIGDNFNKIKLSSTYWFNSLFNSSTEINRGYVPVPVQLFEDIDNDFDDKLTSDKVNQIFGKIEENNSSIMKSLEAYKIPFPVSKMIVKKLIALSIKYSSKE
ncbi:hypothetical protein [Clostridium fungisolvens]|uniref:Uncharacterized protein n=1 Tax=Clostridium fungisolvens TaxID=1604897 RepID=A0A6V8SCD0_9CLOT|nr:hypothetical protein [Clostridium fungisolvens]GFP74899.1 hypothetical protein bsdtw1_00962 [Clostridium fungisolvens]